MIHGKLNKSQPKSLMSLRSQLPGLNQQTTLPFLYEKTVAPLRNGYAPPLSASIWSEHSVKKKVVK